MNVSRKSCRDTWNRSLIRDDVTTGESPEAEAQAASKGRTGKNTTSDKRKEQVGRLDFAALVIWASDSSSASTFEGTPAACDLLCILALDHNRLTLGALSFRVLFPRASPAP